MSNQNSSTTYQRATTPAATTTPNVPLGTTATGTQAGPMDLSSNRRRLTPEEQCTANIRFGSVNIQPEQHESNLISARFSVLRTDIEPVVLNTYRYRYFHLIVKSH